MEITKETFSLLENLTETKYQPHAILGIMKLEKVSYLLIVTGYELIGSILKKEIFTVKDVEFVCLRDNKEYKDSQEVKYYLDGIKALFNTGFYYSFDYDLSTSYQKSKKQKSDSHLFINESSIYNFNYNIKRDFIEAKINQIFSVNMINGYVGISNNIDVSDEEVVLLLISRRSYQMAGTLFNCKGLDEQGNSANFVETEQIMKLGHKTFSFLIYRGSQPLLIKNSNLDLLYSVTLVEPPNEKKTTTSINKHINIICEKEKFNIFFLNLMSDSIKDECFLNKNIQNNLFPTETSTGGLCKYLKFDFNNCFETNDFSTLENFVNTFINYQNANIGYFCEDLKFKSSILQKGVLRTNCMNSLDRTNVMQSAVCWKILDIQVLYYFNLA